MSKTFTQVPIYRSFFWVAAGLITDQKILKLKLGKRQKILKFNSGKKKKKKCFECSPKPHGLCIRSVECAIARNNLPERRHYKGNDQNKLQLSWITQSSRYPLVSQSRRVIFIYSQMLCRMCWARHRQQLQVRPKMKEKKNKRLHGIIF